MHNGKQKFFVPPLVEVLVKALAIANKAPVEASVNGLGPSKRFVGGKLLLFGDELLSSVK